MDLALSPAIRFCPNIHVYIYLIREFEAGKCGCRFGRKINVHLFFHSLRKERKRGSKKINKIIADVLSAANSGCFWLKSKCSKSFVTCLCWSFWHVIQCTHIYFWCVEISIKWIHVFVIRLVDFRLSFSVKSLIFPIEIWTYTSRFRFILKQGVNYSIAISLAINRF